MVVHVDAAPRARTVAAGVLDRSPADADPEVTPVGPEPPRPAARHPLHPDPTEVPR